MKRLIFPLLCVCTAVILFLPLVHSQKVDASDELKEAYAIIDEVLATVDHAAFVLNERTSDFWGDMDDCLDCALGYIPTVKGKDCDGNEIYVKCSDFNSEDWIYDSDEDGECDSVDPTPGWNMMECQDCMVYGGNMCYDLPLNRCCSPFFCSGCCENGIYVDRRDNDPLGPGTKTVPWTPYRNYADYRLRCMTLPEWQSYYAHEGGGLPPPPPGSPCDDPSNPGWDDDCWGLWNARYCPICLDDDEEEPHGVPCEDCSNDLP